MNCVPFTPIADSTSLFAPWCAAALFIITFRRRAISLENSFYFLSISHSLGFCSFSYFPTNQGIARRVQRKEVSWRNEHCMTQKKLNLRTDIKHHFLSLFLQCKFLTKFCPLFQPCSTPGSVEKAFWPFYLKLPDTVMHWSPRVFKIHNSRSPTPSTKNGEYVIFSLFVSHYIACMRCHKR